MNPPICTAFPALAAVDARGLLPTHGRAVGA
jgi:hypothetical protein